MNEHLAEDKVIIFCIHESPFWMRENREMFVDVRGVEYNGCGFKSSEEQRDILHEPE